MIYKTDETGEVDTIILQVYDSKGNVSEKKVKHFKDGRKPEIMEVKDK